MGGQSAACHIFTHRLPAPGRLAGKLAVSIGKRGIGPAFLDAGNRRTKGDIKRKCQNPQKKGGVFWGNRENFVQILLAI